MKPSAANDAERAASRSDAELVLAARRGDKRAFVEIVARHQAMVCGIALGILGDFAASEDAGQEAFLTAWRKFHELREPERLRGWLAQIARNAALGQLRRKRPHDALNEELMLPDDSATPAEAAASEEEAALVRESLAKLPEIHRLPLILYYREGQSVRAVAEALGISEDAVKQRLARGREMLRDRMSGLIETVLTRSKPNAVFTMTIAVAIGALVAPSVMAGSALAAGAAAGASTANATTSPLFTAMSTTKAIFVTAGIVAVLCVPIGYRVSETKTPRAIDTAPVAVAETPAPTAKSAAPDFENSALFAEWRELHAKYGTNGQALPAIYDAIAKLKDPFRRLGFRSALISEWVETDPAGGFSHFLSKVHDDGLRKQFFNEWLSRDPRGAVEALKAGASGWDGVARDCLTNIARLQPASVPDLAARLPKSDSYWDTSVRDAFAIVADGNLTSARQAAEALTGVSRDQALAGVAMQWGKSDLNAAIAWAKGLPDGTDRDEIIRNALLGKAAVDPVAALEQAGSVPSGGRNAFFASTTGARVLSAAAAADFDTTVNWLKANPGRLGQEDLMGLVEPVTERLNADAAGFLSAHAADGSLAGLVPAIDNALLNGAAGLRPAIWDWLKSQPQNEATQAIKNQVLSSASYQDPNLALQLVNDLPNTPEGDREVTNVAERLFNGGHMLQRLDSLLGQAPDRLREPMVEAAFNFLRGDTLDNPQKWVNNLSLLPADARAKGTESLARAWADQAPEDAIAWAIAQPPSATQNATVAAIVSTWAKKDAPDAAAWVGSLPAGLDRDQNTEYLVAAIAQKYPQDAWNWALSINDSASRERAAGEAAKMMAARDPATARQWIQSGPFSDQTKANLQAALPQPGGVK